MAYKFEQALEPMPRRLLRDTPMANLQRLAKKIAHAESPDRAARLTVVAGAGWRCGGWTSYYSESRIVLARHHRCRLILLHEMAHWLTPKSGNHGPEFMRTYMYLLCKYAGIRRSDLNDTARKVGGEVR